jgi:hypothetical protein
VAPDDPPRPVSLPRATAPTPLPPSLPSSAMVTPRMGKGKPATRPSGDPADKKSAVDALLAEFNAVDEPFAVADLAPRRATTAMDLLELDDPLPTYEDDGFGPVAATVPVPVSAPVIPDEPPAPALDPEQAEVLSGYMFEDEHGLEFRIGGARKAPATEDLHDLLRSYLVDEAS